MTTSHPRNSQVESLPVLITGASSGIGKATALYLSNQGFEVFAGVRKSADGDALRSEATGNLTPILLDVTDQDAINVSAKKIAKSTENNLFALINNAGMFLGGPLEILSLSDMQKLIDVNLMGVLAVTKAFIPLLRNRGGGRIVNIGSATGFFGLPGLSVYSASKYALRGLTDSLRLELYPFNIFVSIMEAGNIDTPIWNKGLASGENTIREANEDTLQRYTPLIDLQKKFAENVKGISPGKVAKKIFRILKTKHPKNSYRVGLDARMGKLIKKLPERLLNKIILWVMAKF